MRRLLLPAAALSVALTGCDGGADPATPTSSAGPDRSPSWFGERTELPSCGEDAHAEGYPDHEARSCFRQAFEADRPAELTRLQYGDEGESVRAHFRVLGDGRYEIVGEHFPGAVEYAGGHGWVRYECDRFVFQDDPGAETAGTPWINGAGECEQVEYVPA